MLNDPLAATLAKIMNAEKVGKKNVVVKPASKIIKKILAMMNENNYTGEATEITSERGGELNVNLLGNLNGCGVIKPRFSTKQNGFEKWEKRYLPANNFGLLFVSTPKGIMTQDQAKDKKMGGKLLAYCY